MRAKIQNVLLLLLTGYPLLWLVLFYTYMLCIRAKIGHFPVPMVDTSGFRPDRYPDAADIVLGFGLMAVPATAVVAPIWMAFRHRGLSPSVLRASVILFGLSVISFLSLWNIDPGNCFNWFLD